MMDDPLDVDQQITPSGIGILKTQARLFTGSWAKILGSSVAVFVSLWGIFLFGSSPERFE
jgi:hypothetical protein